jgi:hypothetical protein
LLSLYWSTELESAVVDLERRDDPLELSSLTQMVFSSGLRSESLDLCLLSKRIFCLYFCFLTCMTATSLMVKSI